MDDLNKSYISFWEINDENLFTTTKIPAGLHNTIIFIALFFLFAWLINIIEDLFFFYFRIIKHIYTQEAFCLEGANIYKNDFNYLFRTHFNQIIRQKRLVPPVAISRVYVHLHTHISSFNIITHTENTHTHTSLSNKNITYTQHTHTHTSLFNNNYTQHTHTKHEKQTISFQFDATHTTTFQIFWGISNNAYNKILSVPLTKSIQSPESIVLRMMDRNIRRSSHFLDFFTMRRPNIAKLPLLELDSVHTHHSEPANKDITKADLVPSEYMMCSREYRFPPGKKIQFIPTNEDMFDLKGFLNHIMAKNISNGESKDENIKNDFLLHAVVIGAIEKPQSMQESESQDGFLIHNACFEVTLLQFEFVGNSIKVNVRQQSVFTSGLTAAQEAFNIYGLENEEEMECSICMSNPKNTMLLPCRHCSSCFDCLRVFRQDKCPICRTNFTGFVTFPLKNINKMENQQN